MVLSLLPLHNRLSASCTTLREDGDSDDGDSDDGDDDEDGDEEGW